MGLRNRRIERQGRNRPDAGHTHEAAALRVISGQRQYLLVQPGDLAADRTNISSNNPERSVALCYVTCMAETHEEISDRRQDLIRAARVHPNPDFKPLLETSNADDLEWFLEQIDTQIRETPNWVDDRSSLRQILARLRAKRTAVAGALGNRRTAEKLTGPRAVRLRVNIKMILLGAGILIAFFALLVTIFK